MKTRRVGSVTCGVLLIVFGILFAIHFFFPTFSYEMIFRLWPILLVALGVEMLLSNKSKSEEIVIKYDGAAILLTIVLAMFAMGMGVLEYCMEYMRF